jgi:two-component system chemotaxis response regulator CheY
MTERRALVSEDSAPMRALIVQALKRIDALVVDEATDGVDALKKLATRRYDILLTDVNMPVMDGLKLISLVRRDAVHREIPIIVITTEGGEEDRRRAMSLGANVFIPKPIQAAGLLGHVRTLLGLVP